MPPARRKWGRSAFRHDASSLAQRLIGHLLVRRLDDGARLAGTIVETEAYLGAKDRAAHSFNLHRSPRNESMYAKPGTAYVYFTYGMHHCMNVVCGRAGEPVAVLIRALEPAEGLGLMHAHRTARRRPGAAPLRDTDLCSGPARLCQALAIDRSLDGGDLTRSPDLWIERPPGPEPAPTLDRGPRIGVDSAGRWARRHLRWWVRNNPHVSR